MRCFRDAVTVVSLVLFGVGQARADNILYFVDGNNGTDQMAAALAAYQAANPSAIITTITTNLSGTPTAAQSAANDAAINTWIADLRTGTYQIGIFSAQETYDSNYSAAFSALAKFVQGTLPNTGSTANLKGQAIVDSWFTPLGSDLTPFGATPTGDINGDAVNLTGVLGTGITNPLQLVNPTTPYATFSLGLSATAASPGTFANDANDISNGISGQAAVVVGNPDSSLPAGGDSIVNGFLDDVPQGDQLYINEINALIPSGTPTVPEPSTLTLLGAGIVSMLGYSRARGRKTA